MTSSRPPSGIRVCVLRYPPTGRGPMLSINARSSSTFSRCTFMRATVQYTASPPPRAPARTAEHKPVRVFTGSLAAREGEGDAPGVLLLHGLASSSHIWDLVAPRLAPALRVVAYDQRGHGRSGKPSSGYGFERVTADALAVIRAAALRRPLAVGHSWGANGTPGL